MRLVVPGLRMASLNRVGYGLTVATHVPAEHFPSRRGEVLTVRSPYGERVRNASALGRMTANGRAARMPIHPLRPRFFDPAAEKAELPGLTPHELPHTAASPLRPATVKAIQQMLDHASAAMTLDVYAGLFADDLDAVADRLDRALAKLNADQMRTERRPSRSNQAVLPLENPSAQAAG